MECELGAALIERFIDATEPSISFKGEVAAQTLSVGDPQLSSSAPDTAYAEGNFVDFSEEIKTIRAELKTLSEDLWLLERKLAGIAYKDSVPLSPEEVARFSRDIAALKAEVDEVYSLLDTADFSLKTSSSVEVLGEKLQRFNDRDLLENSRTLLDGFNRRADALDTALRHALSREA